METNRRATPRLRRGHLDANGVWRTRRARRYDGRVDYVRYGGVDVRRCCLAFHEASMATTLSELLDVAELAALRADRTRRAADVCRRAGGGARIPPPVSYEPLHPAEPDLFGRD